jgi:Ca2+-binding EF-hand superfamily protein
MAFKLNSTPTDGNWGFPSIPDKYNVFSKREINPKNAIVVKVFLNGTEMVYQKQIDRSKGVCEQISQLMYFEDWETVEVVRGAPHFDRVGIDLNLIPWIQDSKKSSSKWIKDLMRVFKKIFNDNCNELIAELGRDDAKVWLEVTKFKDPEEEVHRTFEIIDANHDEAISQPEYFKALRPDFKPQVAQKLGLGVVSGQECEERTVAQKRFDNIDQNQDKRLSWDEFRNFYVRKSLKTWFIESLWNDVMKEKDTVCEQAFKNLASGE